MSNDPELLVGVSEGELEALAESKLAISAQARLDALLTANSAHRLGEAELDRLLERVDQLNIFKARARYTLDQRATASQT